MIRSIVVAALIVGSAVTPAQDRRTGRGPDGRPADDWCAEASSWDRRSRVACSVREETLTNVSSLDVDTGGNGGIRVRGTSGSTARLRFRIVARARSEDEARSLLEEIRVAANDGRVRATGPRTSRNDGWSVDVEIESPRSLPLTLATSNGGISIEDVSGRTRFETTNGGVSLVDVAGDVRGSTVNGGVTVSLDGRRWDGAGLDVSTTNGGVRLTLPDGYNAELALETTNGGLRTDFPIIVQGRLPALNRRIVTTLGSGGPRLHLRTVNGGVSIAKH